ncbi:NBAS subunit of NRZ tethering complex-like [Palaemon carinicauda]|uniref:NBAS subunit of NRZ tethering complex-like n=1 Tax=Palaemon carinicauda TaxID=392227 RepID=UPI0035B5CF16
MSRSKIKVKVEERFKKQAALAEAGDYVVASSACEQLVNGDHHEGWVVCEQLGRAHQYANLTARARFLDVALTYAPADHLQDLLDARNEVEMAMLYTKVNTQMDTDDTGADSDDGFVDAISNLESGEDDLSSPESPVKKTGLLQGTLGVTKSVLSVTASTTSNLVTSVASKQFWKSTVSWMQPLHELSSRGESDIPLSESNADFRRQGCHAFYSDIHDNPHISTIAMESEQSKEVETNSLFLEQRPTLQAIFQVTSLLLKGIKKCIIFIFRKISHYQRKKYLDACFRDSVNSHIIKDSNVNGGKKNPQMFEYEMNISPHSATAVNETPQRRLPASSPSQDLECYLKKGWK